jgi:hypothetical protein
MIQKFETRHGTGKIAICIHDIFASCTSDWSKEIAKNLTDYLLNRCLQYGFDVFASDDEQLLIETAANEDYTHCVVIAAGTSTKLSDRLFQEIRKKCSEDFYIAGHVLDREDKYFELHHQFYILNLNIHKELKLPELGESSDIPHSKLKPVSKTNDGYIAQELSQGTELVEYSGTMHGYNILSVALSENKRIVDLGDGIRNNKKYFYYEYDHVFLKESTSLFYNKYFFNNIVVPMNSDILREQLSYTGPVEQYVTLGTGLNWVENLHLMGYTEDTEVFFTDYNPLVLQFMKRMVNEWDGKDYIDFYLKQDFILPNNMPYDFDAYINQCRQQWESFVSKIKDWDIKWNNVRKLKFHFISADYMSDYNFDWFSSDKKTIFNASDMFDHVPNTFDQSLKFRIAAENRFINKLKNKNPELMLLWSGRAATELLSENQGPKFQPISEVELIDIDTITRPYWHKDDWNVLRPLV